MKPFQFDFLWDPEEKDLELLLNPCSLHVIQALTWEYHAYQNGLHLHIFLMQNQWYFCPLVQKNLGVFLIISYLIFFKVAAWMFLCFNHNLLHSLFKFLKSHFHLCKLGIRFFFLFFWRILFHFFFFFLRFFFFFLLPFLFHSYEVIR